MIQSDDTITEIDCELEFEEEKDSYPGRVVLTEDGDLSVQFNQGEGPSTSLEESWSGLDGVDNQGREVQVNNPMPSKTRAFSLTELDTTSVAITKDGDFCPGPDKEVIIEFDVLCFQPNIPATNQRDSEIREYTEENVDDRPKEKQYLYIESDNFEIYGVPFTNTTDRIDIVENEGKRMRTAKIRVNQEKHGTLCHHINSVEHEVQKLLELSQLVQETTPQFVRAKAVSIDGTPIEDLDPHYEKLKTGRTANAGGRFSQYPSTVVERNFPEYIRQAYENYTPHVRERLHLRQVLGYYVDARDPDRPIEPQLLSTCSAIELFSLWHAREDEVSGKTGEKIQHTVNKLNVNTNDLAEEVVPNPDELSHPEYFWKRARNHVAHGDPELPPHDLSVAQRTALILLKRLIRNQLLGDKNRSFEEFYEMQIRPSTTIDD